MNTYPGSFDRRAVSADSTGAILARSAGGEKLASESTLDLHAIWAAIYRSRYLIMIVLAAFLAAGLLVSLLLTPRYRASATVQIDSEVAKVLGTEQVDPNAAAQDSERFLRTQLDIIQSRALANTVATSLKLFTSDQFLTSMGQKPTGALPNLSEEASRREQVIGILQNNLFTNLPPDSRVVQITFRSRDPVLATQVVNNFAENYVRTNLQRKFDNSAYARSFLGEQLTASQAKLQRAERDVVDYARRTRIIDASNAAGAGTGGATAGGSLTSATLVQLNGQLSEALGRRLEAQSQWERARAVSPLTLTDVLSNNAVQQLIQQRATLQAQYEDELKRRKADYPTVIQLKAQVDELNSQVNQVAGNIRSSIKLRYDTALRQENELRNQVNGLKNASFTEQNQNVQLSLLKRQADTYRSQYEYILKRFNELSSEAGVQANNVSIVDRAPIPLVPVFPNVPLNMALALIAGILTSAALVFLRDRLFEGIRTPNDIAERIGLPLLGISPNVPAGTNVVDQLNDAKTSISEAFSSVRTALSLASPDGLPKVIAFTSTREGEGKSTACYATALSLGRSGRSVIILDLDLRRPSQHDFLSEARRVGMSDLLAGNARMEEVVQRSAAANVSIIPGGMIPPNPTELLDSARLDQVIAEAASQYDCVLIDSPPVLGLADAIIVGDRAKQIVYIVESGRNHARGISEALQRLGSANIHILGIVLSRFDPGKAGYAYDYSYTYQYRYET